MSIVLIFIAVVSAIAIWWLSTQRLASKPWLEVGTIDEPAPRRGTPMPVAKIGLLVFLTVVCAVMAMVISSFFMRMAPDWRPLPDLALLWINTGVIILSSVALQRASLAADLGRNDALKNWMVAGGASALTFLVGQLAMLQQLHREGYFLDNPAVGFFYLLTIVHGVHLLGGMVALGRAAGKIGRGDSLSQIRLTTGLCAMYWHFLMAVWVVLFGLLLLTGRFSWFAQSLADIICGVPGA
ncbi:MAG: cytochrome-c oxidase [Acetobacteraceae bacterium]|nr:cytochrome-c oxidase [Acetobacteraceae bacterium]